MIRRILKEIFGSSYEIEPDPLPEPRTHDFSGWKRCWGHDYAFTPIAGGQRGRVSGWCTPRPKVGDYLLLENGPFSTRYVVDAVSYPGDPHDMFFAEVSFAPRPDRG